jgi:ferritin heavy chain
MSNSPVRQNFHVEVEAAINKQINLELTASYVYLSMGAYFDRDDVALEGYSKWFYKNSDEERGHARKLITYQNLRGGRVVLQDIARPTTDDWTSGLSALEAALQLERTVNQSLLDLHKLAETHHDSQCCDFLEKEFLEEQVEAIKELADLITSAKRAGNGLGEYLFDKNTMKEK